MDLKFTNSSLAPSQYRDLYLIQVREKIKIIVLLRLYEGLK